MSDLGLDELVDDLLSSLPDDLVTTVTFEHDTVTAGSGMSVTVSSSTYTVNCSKPAPVTLEQAGASAYERGDEEIVVSNYGDVLTDPPKPGWFATVASSGTKRKVTKVDGEGTAALVVRLEG